MLATETIDLDNGPRSPKSATTRMCAVTRAVMPVDDLIRFVLTPDGNPVADLKRRLPGRGLWVQASHRAVSEAVRRNSFAKGFKKPVNADEALADQTGALLLRGVLDALAMAGKAGQVACGFGKVEDAIAENDLAALLHAADAAPDGVRKLTAAARRADRDDLPVIQMLTSHELDLALGRGHVIHAALLAGAAGKTFLARCRVLVRYRTPDGLALGSLPSRRTNISAAGTPEADNSGTV